MENDPASTPAPGNAPAGLRRSPLRSLVWTVWAAVPLLVRPVSGFSSFCAMVLLALWCAASLYLVAVPSRVDDEADPDGRRAAAKVALGLFAARERAAVAAPPRPRSQGPRPRHQPVLRPARPRSRDRSLRPEPAPLSRPTRIRREPASPVSRHSRRLPRHRGNLEDSKRSSDRRLRPAAANSPVSKLPRTLTWPTREGEPKQPAVKKPPRTTIAG